MKNFVNWCCLIKAKAACLGHFLPMAKPSGTIFAAFDFFKIAKAYNKFANILIKRGRGSTSRFSPICYICIIFYWNFEWAIYNICQCFPITYLHLWFIFIDFRRIFDGNCISRINLPTLTGTNDFPFSITNQVSIVKVWLMVE